MKQLF